MKLKGVLILETVWLNLLRSVCAGVVWMVILIFFPSDDSPFYLKLLYPLFFPFMLVVMYGVSQILNLFNLGGIGNILCMIITVPGDPLLFALFKLKPEIVPVSSLNIIHFVGIILVFEENIPVMNGTVSNEKESLFCPFVGRIIANKEGSVLGFSWPTKGTIFHVDNDWNVISNGTSYGWIDKDGQIRKGLKGKPSEILSPGKIIGKIENSIFYINNEEAGELVKW
jgi:hypothetical protein